jgi:hypothetical protein
MTRGRGGASKEAAEQKPFFITLEDEKTPTNTEWVAQVSLLRPGFLIANGS